MLESFRKLTNHYGVILGFVEGVEVFLERTMLLLDVLEFDSILDCGADLASVPHDAFVLEEALHVLVGKGCDFADGEFCEGFRRSWPFLIDDLPV